MTSTETLRAKQNMEILDVFKNLNSQVNAITRRQIAVFPDTMKPKTQRDLEVEVNVDKSVESINRLLETKLSSLEFIIQNTSLSAPLDEEGEPDYEEENLRRGLPYDKSRKLYQQSFSSLVNTGDIVPLWNGVVRYYQKVGLSKQSQEMVKVKVQDLDANLEAILYGLTQLIDNIFERRGFTEDIGLRILDLLRTKSIYQLISRQVDSSTFELVSVAIMDASFQNIFAELSQERRELLSMISQRGAIGETPIRKIPIFSTQNFDARLKAIADELGVDPSRISPNLKERLRKMNQADFEKFADNAIREVKSRVEQFTQTEQSLLQELDNKLKESEEIVEEMDNLDRIERNLGIEMERLQYDEIERKFDESMLKDVPELPVAPVAWNLLNVDIEDFDRLMTEYYEQKAEFEKLNAIRQDIIEYNQFIRETAEADSRAERDEMIAEKKQQILQIQEELESLTRAKKLVRRSLQLIQERIDASRGNVLPRLARKMIEMAEGYSLQESRGMGKPKSIGTRGLASIRHNYGIFDSESEGSSESEESEDEDVFNFDDKRNEMYYTRPARK